MLSYPRLAFQVTKSEELCGLNTLQTTEGIFLGIFANDKIKKKPPENINIDELKELLLSDMDFESHTHASDYKFIMHQECLNLKTILRSFAISTDNEYITHTMPNNNLISFYANMRNIYAASCINISSISITNNNKAGTPESCYEYQPITFVDGKTLRKGFLTPEGLVIEQAKIVSCKELIQYIQIPNTTKIILRKGEKSLLLDEKYISFLNFHFISNNLEYENFTHNNILSENVDIILSMHEILNNEINAGSIYNPVSENLNIKSKFLEVRKDIENIFQRLKNNVVYFLAVVGAIVITILFLLFTWTVGKLVLEYRLGKRNLNRYDSIENIKMNENNNNNLKKSISLSSLTKKFIK